MSLKLISPAPSLQLLNIITRTHFLTIISSDISLYWYALLFKRLLVNLSSNQSSNSAAKI
jgi:hypothetical protein